MKLKMKFSPGFLAMKEKRKKKKKEVRLRQFHYLIKENIYTHQEMLS